PDRQAARRFFERWFVALRIVPASPERSGKGFLTGYFEPSFPGALHRQEGFTTPLHGRPPDLVTLEQGQSLPGSGPLQAARRLADGSLGPYPTRRDIEDSDVARDWPVIAWVRDPVDRFIMQVQGSARLNLPGGGSARIAYAGRNGHPYVSLGRLLSQTEAIAPADMTMDRLVARLKADPAWSRTFIWNNPSFVFFRIADELDPAEGPIGGAGVSLSPHRSVAADRTIWPYGLPLWLDGALPLPQRGLSEPLQRLTIIQDTGSAIVGAARFDLFYGSGEAAGFVAGLTRHDVSATVLWPRPGGPDPAVP
ncbi:MAG: MltA domain-containing protein, partial [Beijerinckiaceae bacterium]|nr:MltA domain-containing protein [Beijerinckiaceae bacterium]